VRLIDWQLVLSQPGKLVLLDLSLADDLILFNSKRWDCRVPNRCFITDQLFVWYVFGGWRNHGIKNLTTTTLLHHEVLTLTLHLGLNERLAAEDAELDAVAVDEQANIEEQVVEDDEEVVEDDGADERDDHVADPVITGLIVDQATEEDEGRADHVKANLIHEVLLADQAVLPRTLQ